MKKYIDYFNSIDNETCKNLIDNEHAYEFIYNNFPRLSCPDKTIEEIFAFRCWTLRKHIRKTEDGFVFTEFLPNVPWAGKHNTINAPLCHHLNEIRWMKNYDMTLDYLKFFLYEKGDSYRYSIPALSEMIEYLNLTGNTSFIQENVETFERYIKQFEKEHQLENGLFWSIDEYDAMEFSISGTFEGKSYKSIRPTLNAQMYGAYCKLVEVFRSISDEGKSLRYQEKAEILKRDYCQCAYDGDFFKAIPFDEGKMIKEMSHLDIPLNMNVKELIGYIPFLYGLYEDGQEACFRYLFDEQVFCNPYGLTTADMSHSRYLYDAQHECLWNGYIWPFATAQTITAYITLLEKGKSDNIFNNGNLYRLIKTYTEGQYRIEKGKKIPWIDEVISPKDGSWYAREYLLKLYGETNPTWAERGKNYNHSTYIDLIIRGLIGIDISAQTLFVEPRIKGIWKWFKLENLVFKGNCYCIYYDENGDVFHKGCGVVIEKSKKL